MSITQLVKDIKQAGQDYEWYPTTKEIMVKVCNDIKDNNRNILDIGAGDGNVFRLIDSIKPDIITKRYAIEKSELLINNMDANVFVIGTDFHEQTLIDKKVDIIFCNPPYSEYETWAEKIIKDGNCETIYLVVPTRWESSNIINQALKKRCLTPKVIGSFSFENSEYRKARAKVDIVKIYSKLCDDKSNPFDIWFSETFSFEADKVEKYDYEENRDKKKELHELLKPNDLIISLVELYKKDMEKLLNNYRGVEALDKDILKELNVNVESLREGLKQRIEGLKNLYWEELFDNLKQITDRLTSNSRKEMLSTLTDNTSVDFTAQNAYAIVIWSIKNANHYIKQQLLDVYMELTNKDNMSGYKSNKRFLNDEWRYLDDWKVKDELKNKTIRDYKLDYRLVFRTYQNNLDRYNGGIGFGTHDYINDIFTIAKNLGFNVIGDSHTVGEWDAGKPKKFYLENDDKEVLFAEIRIYKNGNAHCKFMPNFMKAFNIEAGRLNGWLKDAQHANEELEIKDAQKYFKINKTFLPSNMPILLAMKGK